ncbi:MAG TPA: CDP-alcohol phosphatidyltransferase family protein [Nitrosomonas mobilis]|nr:CDP-alcohol phosphatidyltransferase family protein [Nitrosomonas mobilis]
MATIYQLKRHFQNLLRPLVKYLAGRGVTANQVTLAAMGLSIVTGVLLVIFTAIAWLWLLIPLVLLVRMALNAIDGMLAREHDMQSSLGAILNELGDVISDVALYLPFALLDERGLWLVVVICLLAIISEMMGVVAVQIGASRRYDGPMGKSDRAFVFGAVGLLVGIEMATTGWLLAVWVVIVVLLSLTIVNRARSALKECRGPASE